jgi:arsenate reductase (thioredoxin)
MIKVLFVCVRNSARSQIAEGLANVLGEGKLQAFSAGTDPGAVSEFAIKALAEIGIDISKHVSKSLDDVAGIDFDYVVSLCSEAEEACPYVPGGAKRLHWPLADPAVTQDSDEDILAAFRATRETLDILIKSFLAENQ